MVFIIKWESRKSNITSQFSLVGDHFHPFPPFRRRLPGRPTKQFGKQLQTVVTSLRTALAKNLKNF